ncbi:lysylphosphatidylglycerol synthase transmembrane domain-containing protein [Hamadaea tsunoensis]|uniref:lysylphosphatidylglycerol synthase transmembrane domain-containing protein n=1 Tax=Hamadaea tsunoensis TaxID=53368 RepID=UPI00041EEBDD|nr:lysylphosphatidylglycerol synthase transmembrane domain-containing protein [Hamadaea tsunoensis]
MTEPTPRPRRRWWRLGLLVVGLGVAAWTLRGRLPDPVATAAQLRDARPGWLIAAALLETASMCAFSEQQRRLLAAFGVRMTAGVSVAMTYARSAIATALPAGAAISAGYAFRRFRTHGASQPVAAAVMVLSGVASITGLMLLYAGNVLAYTRLIYVLAAGAVAGMWALALWQRKRDPAVDLEPPAAEGPWWRRVLAAVRHTLLLAAAVPVRRWGQVLLMAALNWLADLACLVMALHAVGVDVPARTVATAYFATQLVRQIPLTPGGIGVIEASLIISLTAAGAAEAPVAAAVIVYRLLSAWLIIPVGLACAAIDRNGRRAADDGDEPAGSDLEPREVPV